MDNERMEHRMNGLPERRVADTIHDTAAAMSQLPALARCLDQMASLADMPTEPCQQLRARIAANIFNLVVLGEFKRGKTTLVNALIGADLLPVGVVPLTSIVTLLEHGDAPAARVIYRRGAEEDIAPERLWEYVTEKGNPANIKDVLEVRVRYPSALLRDGVRLVDTPGIGSIHQHNTEVTYEFLPNADAVLFVLSVEQPLGRAELDFLQEARAYAGKIFVVMNKADLQNAAELEESVTFTTKILNDVLGTAVRVYAVSARDAIDARRQGDTAKREQSRMPALTQALSRFLMEEKGDALVRSVGGGVRRLLTQARVTGELALKSLRTPLDELRVKIEAFERKQGEVLAARDEYLLLLDHEIARLYDQHLVPDIEAFAARLRGDIDARLMQHFKTVRTLPSRQLQAALQRYAVAEVRQAYDDWRPAEEAKVTEGFDAICRRFAARVDQVVDELLRFASDLFDVPYDAVQAESHWSTVSRFYYKFWDVQVGLQIIVSSLLLALPKVIGDRFILHEARKRAEDYVTVQAGQVRDDLARRLDHGRRTFKDALLERLDATLAQIGAAVRKGIDASEAGAATFAVREQEIIAQQRTLDVIDRELTKILAQADHG